MKNKVRPIIDTSNPKKSILVKKQRIKHSSTYGTKSLSSSIEKSPHKSVKFLDSAKNANLCTVYRYEQVEIDYEIKTKLKSSCACLVF